MDKRKLAKLVVGSAAAFGAGFIVTAIIKQNVVPVKLIHKLGVGVATLALSGIVANEARKYTDDMIDETLDFVETVKDGYKEAVLSFSGGVDVEQGTDEETPEA